MARNPTIVATITAEDRTKAAITTAMAAMRELSRVLRDMHRQMQGGGASDAMRRTAQETRTAADNMRRLGTNATIAKAELTALARVADNLRSLGGIVLGGGLIRQGEKAVESGAELQHVRVGMKDAGLTDDEISAADKRSVELQKEHPSLKRSELLETEKKLFAVLPDKHHVPEMMPIAAKFVAAYKKLHPTADHKEITEAVEQFTKAAELGGMAKTPEALARHYDSMLKAQQVQGSLIRPEDALHFYQRAGGYGAILNERFKATVLPSLWSAMGGDQAGTAITSLGKHLAGSLEGNHAAAKELVALGLAQEKQFVKTKTGEIKGLKSGEHIAGFEDAQHDPFKWLMETVMPKLKEKGFNTDEAIMAELGKIAPNRTAARILQEMYLQREAIENHRQNYERAQGFDSLSTIGKDPIASLQELRTAIENFGATLTSPVMEQAASALHALAQAIASFTASLEAWQKDNPTAAKVVGTAAPAAAIVGGGVLSWGILRGVLSSLGIGGGAAAGAAGGAAAAATGITLGEGAAAAAVGGAIGTSFGIAAKASATGIGAAAAAGFVELVIPQLNKLGIGKTEAESDEAVARLKRLGIPVPPKLQEIIHKPYDPGEAFQYKRIDDHEMARRRAAYPGAAAGGTMPNRDVISDTAHDRLEERRNRERLDPRPPANAFERWLEREKEDWRQTREKVKKLFGSEDAPKVEPPKVEPPKVEPPATTPRFFFEGGKVPKPDTTPRPPEPPPPPIVPKVPNIAPKPVPPPLPEGVEPQTRPRPSFVPQIPPAPPPVPAPPAPPTPAPIAPAAPAEEPADNPAEWLRLYKKHFDNVPEPGGSQKIGPMSKLETKTEVSGTVSGEAVVNQSTIVTVGLDGEAKALLRNATKIPLAGKLGTTLSGSNGTQPQTPRADL